VENVGCQFYSRNQQFCNDGVGFTGDGMPGDQYTPDALGAREACCACGGGQKIKVPFPPATLTEDECVAKCLNMLDCTGLMHASLNGSHHIAGECWIGTYVNPHKDVSMPSDRLWMLDKVEVVAPTVIQDFCDDEVFYNATSKVTSSWADKFNRTCQDYRLMGFCNTVGINFTWTKANISNASNITNHSDRSSFREFYPYHGKGWDFLNISGEGGETFDKVQGLFGAAPAACCGCGKIAKPLGYKTFVRRHGNITIFPDSIADLLCSPDLQNYLSPFASSSTCVEPMQETVDDRGHRRCCVNPNASVPLLVERCTSTTCTDRSDPMKIVDYNLSSTHGWVIADGLSLRDSEAAGLPGQTVRLFSTQPIFGKPVDGAVSMQGAILRPIVEGKIFDIQIRSRGAGYIADPYAILWPIKRPENHNSSMWADNDAHTSFKDARITFAIGFPGDVEGTFDGRNVNYMCGTAPPSERGMCITNPYGQGFGACISLTRARGARLAASTSVIDFTNVTDLDTTGASHLVAFRIHDIQFLAVANYFNRSKLVLEGQSEFPFSSPTWQQNIDHARQTKSQLFRLSASSEGLVEAELVQEFETISASHVSHSIVDGYHMLAFAQEVAETSAVFAFHTSTPVDRLFSGSAPEKFELIQRPPTRGARSMHSFTANAQNGGESFFVVAQTGDAQQCALEGDFSLTPLCGVNGSGTAGSGRVRLGMAFDLNLTQAQSMMLRWNGSRLNANNLIETLPSDLAGGQSFRSHAATELLPFQSRDGKEHVLILNLEDSEICRDHPAMNCTGKYSSDQSCSEPDSDGIRHCGRKRCFYDRAFKCDVCPRTCGTCDICNSALQDARKGHIIDRPLADLARLGLSAPCGSEAMIRTTPAGLIKCTDAADQCLACPVTCGKSAACITNLLGSAGANYGPSRTLLSHVTSVRHEKVAGLQGPSSVVVSPDGLHVYVGSYSGGSIACFNRNASTGLLIFNPIGGLLSLSAQNAAATPQAVPAQAPSCKNSADDCGGAGYLYHGLKKMILTSSGEFMYAVSFENGALHTLRRNATNGQLTPLGAPLIDGGVDDLGFTIDGLAGANDVFLSHDELNVYVAAFADQAIAVFARSDEIRQGGLLFRDRIKNGQRYILCAHGASFANLCILSNTLFLNSPLDTC